MPDLDALFESFDTPATPPPGGPVDVRRRGERLRRRNRLLVAAGTAAAVVAVAVPLALLNRADETTAPPLPADIPAIVASPLTAIPDDFPIQDGVTGQDAVTGTNDAGLSRCGTQFWTLETPSEATDFANLGVLGDVGDRLRRDVVLYGNPEDASGALAAIRRGYTECPTTPRDTVTPVESPLAGADESAVFRLTGSDGVNSVIVVVRTGNLLFLSQTGVADATTSAAVDDAVEDTTPIVAAMGAFRAGSVVLDPDATLADDRVLRVEDLPSDPWAGTWTAVDPAEPLLCQQGEIGDLGASATLSRRFTSSGGEVRSVVLELDDEAAAARVRTEVASWFATCPDVEPVLFDAFAPAPGVGFRAPVNPDIPSGTSVDIASGGLGTGRIVATRPTDGVSTRYVAVAVAQVGDRVVLLSYERPGPELVRRVDGILRAAADRMVGLEPQRP